MKNIFILLLCMIAPFLQEQDTILFGKITEKKSAEAIIGANIILYQNGTMVAGTVSDYDGTYRLTAAPGTYDVEVTYTGYASKRINGVVVNAGQKNKLDMQLAADMISLDEVVVTEYKVPIITKDNTTQGAVVSGKRTRSKTKGASLTIQKSSAQKAAKAGKKSDKTTRKAKQSFAKAQASPPNAVASAEKNTSSSAAHIEPGQLTAGEWKDLDHWTFWSKLVKDDKFAKYQKYWGYYPQQRFSVKLSDEQGRAVANITVNLLNASGETVWTTRTDNKGSAELWGNFFGGSDNSFQLQVRKDDLDHRIEAIPYTKGLNNISLPLDCSAEKKVDVAFVIDATHSMLDEMKYLRAEVEDVIERVEEENEVKLRSGVVFYTDRHYTDPVYSTPLSEDHGPTVDLIKTHKNRSGGKEWAEAPDLGLSVAIREMDWQEDAIARIVFLILDAPPHYKSDLLADLQQTIRQAAANGIKIIPVAASGIKKDSEFLLKFFAMATNGTYTFLTDHSGIGNPHIKPEAEDYNIETLNDLLVRLIGESATYHDCEEQPPVAVTDLLTKEAIKKAKKKKNNKSFFNKIKCFPNPATDHFFVDLGQPVELMLIASADAKITGQYPKLETGQIKVNTTDWPAGMYFVHFYNKGQHIVEKMVVTHH